MAFFISHVISTRDAHISPKAAILKNLYYTPHHPLCNTAHIITPPCNTDRVITPLGDVTCFISDLSHIYAKLNIS